MSSHRFIFVASAVLAMASFAMAADEPDIGEVLKRPTYRAAYQAMLAGRRNLPKWMATPEAIADSTTSGGSRRVVDGQAQEVFEMCKPDACDTTGLVVMFSGNGTVAKGLLSDEDDVFFGAPSEEEIKTLLTIKNND